MKNKTALLKPLLLLFVFFFVSNAFGQNSEPTPWVKKKVRAKYQWYQSKNMGGMQFYQWSDPEMNRLLGDFEGAVIRKKSFLIPGFISLGIGGLMAGAGLASPKRDCSDPDFCSWDVRKAYITAGSINMGIGVGFLLGGREMDVRSDALLVKIMERYREIGL